MQLGIWFIISCAYLPYSSSAGRRLDETSNTTTQTPCQPGQGFNSENACEPCARGRWSSAGVCQPCAQKKTTAGTGTISREGCTVSCPDVSVMALNLGQTTHYTLVNNGFNPFNRPNMVTNILTLKAAAEVGPTLDIFEASPFNNVNATRVVDACANALFEPQSSHWTYDLQGQFYLAVTGPPGEPYTVAISAECSYVPEWNAWQPCSVTCGSGTQMRTRNVTQASDPGCEPLVDTRTCSAGVACKKDCATTSWSNWGHISATCGPAQQASTRKTVHSTDCTLPELTRTEFIDMGPCPENCAYRQVNEECNATCGDHSYRNIKYKIIANPIGNGTACPSDYAVKCNVPKCIAAVYTNTAPAWVAAFAVAVVIVVAIKRVFWG